MAEIVPFSAVLPKVILITQRLLECEFYPETRQALSLHWVELFRELGNCVAVPLTFGTPLEDYVHLNPAGIVLTGGNNLADLPSDAHDISNPHLGDRWSVLAAAKDDNLSRMRDEYELRLIQDATTHGLPILAVCRGMQLISRWSGGSVTRVRRHSGVEHVVRLQIALGADDLIAGWYRKVLENSEDVFVNSFHNFAVSLPADGPLQPRLLDDHGNVEAACGVLGKSRVVAVMWHPERKWLGRSRGADCELIRSLFDIDLRPRLPPRAIVLCAGQGTRLRPLTDNVPKCMVKYQGHAIIDYILASLRSEGIRDICLVRGYRADALQRHGVRYALNPRYDTTNMVETLFCALGEASTPAPHECDTIVSYSDIVYTPAVVRALVRASGDVCVVVDRCWRALWEARMDNPLSDLETLKIGPEGMIYELGKKPQSYEDIAGQYIGLMKFSSRGMAMLQAHYSHMDRTLTYDGKSFDNMYMTSLIQSLIDAGVNVHPVFIEGGWTEIDSCEDLKYRLDTSTIPVKVAFGTKADTLERVAPTMRTAKVLPLCAVTMRQWSSGVERASFIKRALKLLSAADQAVAHTLIVRSSCTREDTHGASNAGRFLSVTGVLCTSEALAAAVDRVFESFEPPIPEDQVLVQPYLERVRVCGVAFTAELQSHYPYTVLSYDDTSGSTNSVTSGSSMSKTVVRLKYAGAEMPPARSDWEARVYTMLSELEESFECTALDVEFAVDARDELYCLQVRPISTRGMLLAHCGGIAYAGVPWNADAVVHCHRKIYKKVLSHMTQRHQDLPGSTTMLGIMTDWNPAEMIGVRPRPLARSLYMVLVTDKVAMQSRAELGYRRTTAFPLMLSLLGCPYIDLRVSFTSFVPQTLDHALADKLVDYYLARIRAQPELHDKAEFEVLFTCHFPGLRQKLQQLQHSGFSESEIDRIWLSLLTMTNDIVRGDEDILTREKQKIFELEKRRAMVMSSSMHIIIKIYHLLQDIKQYGMQPFAKFARFGFMSKAMLAALVHTGAMTEHDVEAFMQSLNTISRTMGRDIARVQAGTLTKDDFLVQYGHLRPGTYDILSFRYDEAFEDYFPAGMSSQPPPAVAPFAVPADLAQRIDEQLLESGLRFDTTQLFAFMQTAVEWREYSKFVFSRALSDVLVLCEAIGKPYGLTRDDMSYVPVDVLERLYHDLDLHDLHTILQGAVDTNRQKHEVLSRLQLPPLIVEPTDVLYYADFKDVPTFVTLRSVVGCVKRATSPTSLTSEDLRGCIVCIPNADPGWDWVFTRSIGGLVTCYGGSNSHMTIRAAELNLPAVVGAGTSKYEWWASASVLSLDCCARSVTVVSIQ